MVEEALAAWLDQPRRPTTSRRRTQRLRSTRRLGVDADAFFARYDQRRTRLVRVRSIRCTGSSRACRRSSAGTSAARSVSLRGAILGLARDPRPAGARRLVARPDLWRIRVRIDGAPWRIICQLRDPERLVIVTRVARRDEATYRRL
ncbi:MAG: type II toxin-antitoxin system RelE/ParE family toxin [Chloroflexota bacterium]